MLSIQQIVLELNAEFADHGIVCRVTKDEVLDALHSGLEKLKQTFVQFPYYQKLEEKNTWNELLAGMAEQADALDLKSNSLNDCGGSSPSASTKNSI